MTGPLGIWQHARRTGPRPGARHVHGRRLPGPARRSRPRRGARLATRSRRAPGARSSFLAAAFQPDRAAPSATSATPTARGSTRRRSEDSQGARHARPRHGRRDRPRAGLPGPGRGAVRARRCRCAGSSRALRAIASVALGCAAALANARPGGPSRAPTEAMLSALAARLLDAFAPSAELDPDWPWPESVLTYENTLPARALIVAGQQLDDARLQRAGLATLDWLIEIQTAPSGVFSPIGNRTLVAARRDPQPVRPAADRGRHDDPGLRGGLVGHRRPALPRRRGAAYGWFLGDNDSRVSGRRAGGRRAATTASSPTASTRTRAPSPPSPGSWPWRRIRALRGVARRRCRAVASRPRRLAGRGDGRRTLIMPQVRVDQSSLFERSAANPIITAGRPAVPGERHLQPRAPRRVGDDAGPARARRGHARASPTSSSARSRDGVTDWRFDDRRCSSRSRTCNPEEVWGCEDPRLTWLPELEDWAITYTAYSHRGPLVSLAMTQGLHRGPAQGAGDAAGGQGRGDLPAPVRRPLGDDPSARRRCAAARTSGSRTRPTCATGATTRCCSRRATGPGGTPGKIGLGPPPAGDPRRVAHLLPRRPHGRVRADLPDRPRAARPRRPAHGPATAAPTWVLGADRSRTSSRGDVNKVVFPNGWVLDPVTDVLSHLLRRRRLGDRGRHGEAGGRGRERPGVAARRPAAAAAPRPERSRAGAERPHGATDEHPRPML